MEILGDDNGDVRAMRCISMELGEPDSSGRRRPVAIAGSEHEFEVDQVVFAVADNDYVYRTRSSAAGGYELGGQRQCDNRVR